MVGVAGRMRGAEYRRWTPLSRRGCREPEWRIKFGSYWIAREGSMSSAWDIVDDRYPFFGRKAEVRKLVDRTTDKGITAVVGRTEERNKHSKKLDGRNAGWSWSFIMWHIARGGEGS